MKKRVYTLLDTNRTDFTNGSDRYALHNGSWGGKEEQGHSWTGLFRYKGSWLWVDGFLTEAEAVNFVMGKVIF
jgi:hypothetical protein